MGVEDLRELFAYAGRGASDDEDLLLLLDAATRVYRVKWRYLARLIGDVLLCELGFGRECLADLIAHCCGLGIDAEQRTTVMEERSGDSRVVLCPLLQASADQFQPL